MKLVLLMIVQLTTLLQLWFISLSRNISLKTTWFYLWVGTLGVTALTMVVHLFTTRLIVPHVNTYSINPLVEEALTILPLLFLIQLTPLKEKLGILDCMILGAALGCGFGLMETGIRIIGSTQNWDFKDIHWANVLETLFTWVPDRLQYGQRSYAGHGILGAFMGLGAGYWNKYKKWGWIVFVVTFVWAFLDHSLNNYTLGSAIWQKKWAKGFWHITGQGRTAPWFLLLGILGTLVYQMRQHQQEYSEKLKIWFGEFADFMAKMFVPVFWTSRLDIVRTFLCSLKEVVKGKDIPKKLFLSAKIYFWAMVVLVFFMNGILPLGFYRWFLKTPFWWAAGIMGHAMAIWAGYLWFERYRKRQIPQATNSQLVFYGQGILACASLLFVVGSIVVINLQIHGGSPAHYLRWNFLFYAAGTFWDFIKNGLAAALGVFNGIGGSISEAYAGEVENTTGNAKLDETISKLDESIQQDVTNFINQVKKDLGIQLTIPKSDGYRTFEEQDGLYKIGRQEIPGEKIVTNAKGGESYHNYGMAFDVYEIKDGKINEKIKIEEVAKIAKNKGFEWGGDWKGKKNDPPHFQKSTEEIKKKIEEMIR